MSVNSEWGMYVIGKVESNNTWDSINYRDPITLGMMQWYGTRAAELLNRLTAHWGELASTLQTSLQTHTADDSWWTGRYVTGGEGSTLKPVLDSVDGHAAQQAQWDSDWTGYVAKAGQYGFTESNPQALILWLCAYHQSPRRAQQIAVAIGGDSSMARVYQAIMAEPVLSQYPSRYTTARDLLAAWDGTSAAPNFGQSAGPAQPGGDPAPGASQPAPTPSASSTAAPGMRALLVQGDIVLAVDTNGGRTPYYSSGGQLYAGGTPAAPAAPPAVTVPAPTPTPDPPAGGTGSLQEQVVNYGLTFTANGGAFYYTQGPDRWKPTATGGADCSSFTRLCYVDVAGIDPGTYTGAQRSTGTGIYTGNPSGFDRSLLVTGDLIIVDWDGDGKTDHVVMYMGSVNPDHVLSHGGPDKGPDVETLEGTLGACKGCWIRRYI